MAGLARLGFITQFLSKPVMDGFVLGLAIFVAVGQLNKLFGVAKPEGNTVQRLVGIIGELPQSELGRVRGRCGRARGPLPPPSAEEDPGRTHRAVRRDRGELLALDLGGTRGVAVALGRELPQGLPSLAVPDIPIDDYLAMVLPAIGVLLVAFSESLGY